MTTGGSKHVPAGTSLVADPWHDLSDYTDARIALGRAGSSLPTRENLRFSLAHALARDAVHTPFNMVAMREDLARAGFQSFELQSAAPTRDVYLCRPDLGRRLSPESVELFEKATLSSADIVFVVADGLSSTAVHENAVPFFEALRNRLETRQLTVSSVALVRNGRVAVGDEIGERLAGKLVVVAIGERPGLSASDSLGVYLTYQPRTGKTDAERNCISNIRLNGVSPAQGADTAAWLIAQALLRRMTGVSLKDESGDARLMQIRDGGR